MDFQLLSRIYSLINQKLNIFVLFLFVYRMAMSFIIGLVLASTINDVWRKQFVPDPGQSSTLKRAIHCFSIVRNVPEFLKDSGGEEISCLNGIRALTSLVTVNSHLALIGLAGLINQETVHKVNLSLPILTELIQIFVIILKMQMMSSWHAFPFTNIMNYLMDCCFLIGGICTSTSMLQALNRGRFNIFSFYFHRFLR